MKFINIVLIVVMSLASIGCKSQVKKIYGLQDKQEPVYIPLQPDQLEFGAALDPVEWRDGRLGSSMVLSVWLCDDFDTCLMVGSGQRSSGNSQNSIVNPSTGDQVVVLWNPSLNSVLVQGHSQAFPFATKVRVSLANH